MLDQLVGDHGVIALLGALAAGQLLGLLAKARPEARPRDGPAPRPLDAVGVQVDAVVGQHGDPLRVPFKTSQVLGHPTVVRGDVQHSQTLLLGQPLPEELDAVNVLMRLLGLLQVLLLEGLLVMVVGVVGLVVLGVGDVADLQRLLGPCSL